MGVLIRNLLPVRERVDEEDSSHESLPPYPRKVGYFSDELCPSQNPATDLAFMRHALQNGLDPNVLWNEDELATSIVGGGCTAPHLVTHDCTWPHWNTPLHRAVWIRDFEGAEVLLLHGADIDLFNSIQKTVLREAVWHGWEDAVAFILKQGADPNKRTVKSNVRYEHRNMDVESEGDFSLYTWPC